MNDSMEFRLRFRMQAEAENAEVMVFGDIVARKYGYSEYEKDSKTATEFDRAIKSAVSSGAKKLLLRINSGGGDVWSAISMRTSLLTAAFEEIEVRVEGLCASAATLLTCLPDAKVKIAKGSMYMIHNPMSGCWGTAAQLIKQAEWLEKSQNEMMQIYAAQSGADADTVKDWMDAETWFTAEEAVEHGFAGEIIGGKEVETDGSTMHAMSGMYMHTPAALIAAAGTNPVSTGENPAENNNLKGESTQMENEMTLEKLREMYPQLMDQAMSAGTSAERERMEEIDALTLPGYEALASEAKKSGMSAHDFQKAVVAAQKQKHTEFLNGRKADMQENHKVPGAAPEDENSPEAQITAFAQEVGRMAAQMKADEYGRMF